MNARLLPAYGFSLVELMIAMVLGLFALSGILEIFLSSKATYLTTDAIARTQESARYSQQFVAREIRMAGYSAGLESGIFNESILFPAAGAFSAGIVLFGENNVSTAGLKAGTDTLNVRYSGNANGQVRDCQGNTVSATAIASVKLYVSDSDELVCQVGDSVVVLVDGIADMQLTYGIDSNADRFANDYVSASSSTDWSKVAGVRVALTVLGSSELGVEERDLVSVVAARNQLP